MPDYGKFCRAFSFKSAENELGWFKGKKLNAAYNAIDRHVEAGFGKKKALVWIGEKEERILTYEDVMNLSNKFANVLKKYRVRKGDRVFLFLPRVPELYTSFLGILKRGAVAGTLFSAFAKEGLVDRIGQSEAVALVTHVSLLDRVLEVKRQMPKLKHIFVVGGKGGISYEKEIAGASDKYNAEPMKKGDFAFMLYTSGTTGKSKGIVHCHYAMLQAHLTAKYALDLKEDDIYWCTADPGWVTGVVYGILGPWSNRVTQVAYEGQFSVEKWHGILRKYNVSVWYTAPTAVRMIMAQKRNSEERKRFRGLRYIASVGEPLNPEAIKFGMKEYGMPIHDNWWQTETGGILIANFPCMDIRLGSMGKPCPGIVAEIVDDRGKAVRAGVEGNLAIKPGWPSMMKTIWKNEKKYKSCFAGKWYISGDRALKDRDGYFWFIGRADDVIKTAGHRVGPFEVESALVAHPAIAEAGVIGKPDPLYGEIIKAFVVLNPGYRYSNELYEDIKAFVKKNLAGHAYPKEIEVVESLPKTRSGKIMRRVLKAKELGLPLGDLSTLERY
ncbi:acetate--CoA ligase [Candidatus Woesearchaeota archaeon]|nr:acetate--CoA ligase [Candidatus Woesearchaeota archaeon]